MRLRKQSQKKGIACNAAHYLPTQPLARRFLSFAKNQSVQTLQSFKLVLGRMKRRQFFRKILNKKMKKNKYITALLALFLGGLGFHRLYLGQFALFLCYVLAWVFMWQITSIVAFFEVIYFLFVPENTFNQKYN